MANDISGINSSRSQQTGDRQVTGVKKEATTSTSSAPNSKASSKSSGADRVSLTDTAERLKALEHQLAMQPDVDKKRVSNVQDAISNGDYKIDPERIADKMIDFEAAFSK